MNPEILTTVGAAVGIVIASWTILSNFDRRNSDRFDSLQKQTETLGSSLRKEIEATRDTLRAEMREMRAELRLEIKEAADRRIVR